MSALLPRLLPVVVLLIACARADDEILPLAEPAPVTADAVDPRVAAADSSRIRGSADAPLWLIEISDYQCPYCRLWHEDVFPVIDREYVQTGRLRFAYLHFPLEHHSHAQPAAEAAMCAGAQGRFWEMHDAIFSTQREWVGLSSSASFFDELAGRSGVELEPFRSCVRDRVMRDAVAADLTRMRQAGVRATPTFYLGNLEISGAQPPDVFRQLIDSVLAARGEARPTTP